MAASRLAARLLPRGGGGGPFGGPLARAGLPLVVFCVAGYAFLARFVENKVEAMDSRRRASSERAVHLEMAHAAIVGRLGLDEGYDIKPIPRPPDEA